MEFVDITKGYNTSQLIQELRAAGVEAFIDPQFNWTYQDGTKQTTPPRVMIQNGTRGQVEAIVNAHSPKKTDEAEKEEQAIASNPVLKKLLERIEKLEKPK